MAIALITGTSSGIGRLSAEALARAGHTVYAAMRNRDDRNRHAAENLLQVAQEQRLDIRVLDMDVQNEGSVCSAVERLIDEASRIDVVVNNAGIMSIGLAEGFTEAQVAHQMDVNFLGPVRVCRAVLPHMRRQRQGLLVHVTSIAGRLLFPGCAFYCASKFAQEAYAEVLHYELKGIGLESVIVEPGPYPSRLLSNSPGPGDSTRVAEYGPLAGLRDQFVAEFEQMFSSPDAPNTQEVADAILGLVQMSPGTRPIRTVCGVDFGARELNQAIAPYQAAALRALGMEQMTPLAITEEAGNARA